MCSSWSAAVDRRRALARRALRELLQPSSSSQRDWICYTTGQAGGARGTNLCRARSQTGRRAAAATDPPSGRVGKTEYRWRLVGPAAKLIAPGETEVGSAGKQPCRGITRWAHRDDEVGACEHCSAPPNHLSADLIRAIGPDALKILARGAKHLCLTKNGDSPFPAEPEHSPSHSLRSSGPPPSPARCFTRKDAGPYRLCYSECLSQYSGRRIALNEASTESLLPGIYLEVALSRDSTHASETYPDRARRWAKLR